MACGCELGLWWRERVGKEVGGAEAEAGVEAVVGVAEVGGFK